MPTALRGERRLYVRESHAHTSEVLLTDRHALSVLLVCRSLKRSAREEAARLLVTLCSLRYGSWYSNGTCALRNDSVFHPVSKYAAPRIRVPWHGRVVSILRVVLRRRVLTPASRAGSTTCRATPGAPDGAVSFCCGCTGQVNSTRRGSNPTCLPMGVPPEDYDVHFEQVARLAKARAALRARHAFSAGDKVTWTGSDADVPPGDIGDVVGHEAGGQAIVRFSAGQWNFHERDLVLLRAREDRAGQAGAHSAAVVATAVDLGQAVAGNARLVKAAAAQLVAGVAPGGGQLQG